MRFSIVVTFHSGVSLLRLCLESLLTTVGADVEIVVLMNNADDREIDTPLDLPRVRVVRIKENLGYADAANTGAAEASGDFLVFADHDVVFTEGWLEAVQSIHFQSSSIGATSVRIANPHTFRILDFGIGFTRLNCPHPHQDQKLDSSLVSASRRVQAMCCGGLTIERKLFERMGGFDSELTNFYTDIDLCLRLKALERECWVAAKAVAYHFGGDFSQIDRPYKANFLKSDVKAWFRAKNNSLITVDMDQYYAQSWETLVSTGNPLAEEYVACCMMNVADPHWYLEVFRKYRPIVDVAIVPTGRRDAGNESLYELLGYDLLVLRAPIVYFVDRFVSLGDNRLWWDRRGDKRDIIVDRNGNVVHILDL